MDNALLQLVAVVVSFALLGIAGGRELRPSDHGIEFQENSSSPPLNGEAQEMRSFFGASTVQLPEAKNISDTWLSSQTGAGRARDAGRRDHVRLGLLAASAACALIGVVLLAVSGVVFLFRLRRRQQQQGPKTERISSTSALTSSLPPIHAEK